MDINLPIDLESSIRAEVASGRFASIDEAMAEAARLLLGGRTRGRITSAHGDVSPDPVIGCMRDDVELMDEIVAEAYRQRREEPRREIDL